MAPLLTTHKGRAPVRHGSGAWQQAWPTAQRWQRAVQRGLQRVLSPRRPSMARLFAASALAMVFMRLLLLWVLGPRDSTLVVYIAGYSDPESMNNVDFFMKHGMRANDGAHYVIAVEQDYYLDVIDLFPAKLPRNVEIVQTQVKCFNWGTLGWVLRNKVDYSRYRHFVWLDSSVRGPFMPNYVEATGLRWHQLLTGMINKETKLVGGTISCAGIKINPDHPTLFIPHVHGYLQATDRVGLDLLLAADSPSGVLACHQNFVPAVRFSEIGASETILLAGYNIASLMLKYRGVDFRDRHMWNCNDRINPLYAHMYDGSSPSPLETMFVKVQHHGVINHHPTVVAAVKYESWAHQQPLDINLNAFKSMVEFHLERVKAKGQHCFDPELYIAAGPTEFANYTHAQAWEHFIMFGYREGRPHRFIC